MDKWDYGFFGLPDISPPTPPNFTPPSSPDSIMDEMFRIYHPSVFSRGKNIHGLRAKPCDISARAMNMLQCSYLFGEVHMEMPKSDSIEFAEVYGDVNGRSIHVHYNDGHAEKYTCCNLALTPTGKLECFCDKQLRHMCLHKETALFALHNAEIHSIVDRTLASLEEQDHPSQLGVQLLKHKYFGCHAKFDAREHRAHVVDERDGRTVFVDTWSDYFNCSDEECIALCTSLECEHVKKVALAASTMGIFKRNIQNVFTAFEYYKRIRIVEEEGRIFVSPTRRIAFDMDMDPPVMLTFNKGTIRCTGYYCQRSMAMCRHVKASIEYMLLMDSDKFHEIAGDTSRYWDYKPTVGSCSCDNIISLEEFKDLYY